MTVNNLEIHIRYQPGVAILDLHGEINAFGEDALNAAYAEAERGETRRKAYATSQCCHECSSS